ARRACRPESPPTTTTPPRCPAGQRYSPALHKCLPLAPTKASRPCPKGYRHDAARDRCVYVPDAPKGRCPASYYYHHYYRRCLPNQYLTTFGRYCPPGQVRIKGRCRPRQPTAGPAKRRCPAGYHYHLAAGRCVPRGYFPRNTGRCPEGYYYHHYYRRCLLNRYRRQYGVHCPPGYQVADGRCRVRARPRTQSCPAGYYYHHYYRQCLLNRYRAAYGVHCPPGYFYHPGRRRCLRRAARPTASPRVRCPAGQVYDPVLGRCRGQGVSGGASSRPPRGTSWCPRGQFFHFQLRRCLPYSYLSR
ncbi:MAG: hypothetical protein KKC37_06470, partial [Proteobacteria bacterium]|nr:hypothetical protein [Pseudomonadota bacterium]